MSYILDALRKSETERRQGRVPDLGQQVQMIHKPRKETSPVLVLVAIGLVLNAAILVWVFWPGTTVRGTQEPVGLSEEIAAPVAGVEPVVPEQALESPPETTSPESNDTLANAIEIPVPRLSGTPVDEGANPVAESGIPDERERPTVIVPTPREPSAVNPSQAADNDAAAERTPHLVELPLSFQKRVPDLIFNSHIYGSEPSSRRVMINDNYLRHGESFSGITVERITEEGVELSMDGRRFRVGVVRNWVSPE
ncbi:general secretion pathway protein GspB [Marinobacter sp. TBZ242]|uniref:General secretion pathway protein GspB n=1 Tax=Marinobacter azerbaijanicus TaxID=3050455 RepID=A0ABT7I6C6_9GAMM|nr:general secretion pathway protein GspB [Marinobacter sp. TBZ242]MDL0429662.1 general secretion pathway protein GspB [Marinobacter sp. TBZ242]